jgi:hypothetical protein
MSGFAGVGFMAYRRRKVAAVESITRTLLSTELVAPIQ